MQKNLRARALIIAGTILACIFGVIGFPKSKASLLNNIKDNIRLGLDLKGGSHLVLQVQVQDAAKAEADQTMDQLKEELKKQNITWASMDHNDPQTLEQTNSIEIDIKGVPATQSSAFRNLVTERAPDWVLTALNSTDYALHMKPSALVELKRDTVDRSVQTISNRIDSLGLAEKAVQQYGPADEEQILVQLPGVDDPARVKELIGTAAVLEICDVQEGPFPSQEAARAQHGGVLPLNTTLVKALPRGQPRRRVVSFDQIARDHRPRHAQRAPRPGRVPQMGDRIHSFSGWGQTLRCRHGRTRGQ
jgi:preprotein translocase subunit SecD